MKPPDDGPFPDPFAGPFAGLPEPDPWIDLEFQARNPHVHDWFIALPLMGLAKSEQEQIYGLVNRCFGSKGVSPMRASVPSDLVSSFKDELRARKDNGERCDFVLRAWRARGSEHPASRRAYYAGLLKTEGDQLLKAVGMFLCVAELECRALEIV